MKLKTSPEEDRLSTCARLYAEHPDNAVAWVELRKAAVQFARSPLGRKLRVDVLPVSTRVRTSTQRRASIDEKKRRRQEWEAQQRGP